MDGYKVCSVNGNGTKEYLVLDIIADVEKNKFNYRVLRRI